MPRNRTKSAKSRGKKPDITYKPGISFNALNGECIPVLHLEEYEFDAVRFRKVYLKHHLSLPVLKL